jgi:hypothetical protein
MLSIIQNSKSRLNRISTAKFAQSSNTKSELGNSFNIIDEAEELAEIASRLLYEIDDLNIEKFNIASDSSILKRYELWQSEWKSFFEKHVVY